MTSNYRGYDVYELPGNGQGMVTLQILNLIEGFDLKTMGFQTTQTFHTMIEAKKTRLGRPREILRRPRLFSINPSPG